MQNNLYFGTMKRRHYAGEKAENPWAGKRVLIVGMARSGVAAAQLLFMDRVPDHAAVDEAVKQARASGREGLSGLVNGVLRASTP